MSQTNAHLEAPVLEMRADGTPVSAVFGDVYFSRAGGVAETCHVFLDGNGLPERWCAVDQFTIGELGFGTGLNFLVTLKRFRATAKQTCFLQYVAVEKYPFTVEQLRTVLALQPELRAEAEEFLAAYPLRLPGMHRIIFGNVRLTLCFGDVSEMLPQWNVPIDAWYLDGFAPAKNTTMWEAPVLAQVGRLSAPGATFATFTAAGAVKRGLQAAGFDVRKVPGFGHKREMLVGEKSETVRTHERLTASRVVVIGAGIAGACVARALAERGLKVTVLECAGIAQGASGNTAAVLFPQLTKQWNRSTAWYFTAYGFTLRQLQRWREAGLVFASGMPGMLRLPRHAEGAEQLRQLGARLGLDSTVVHWVEQAEARAYAGIPLASGAAYFPQGMWVCPKDLCTALLQHDNIAVREACAANAFQREDDQWQVICETGERLVTHAVCIAAAGESAALLHEFGISLNAVGGQVSMFAATNGAPVLRSIVCHSGYVIPQKDGYLVGATYHREALLEVTQARHAENAASVAAVAPGLVHSPAIEGRSSVRATTPDRLPYIGAVAEGLYLSTGHGSRGMLSAPLAGEMIASAICGEMSPVDAALRTAVRPLRFGARFSLVDATATLPLQ